MPPGEPPSEPAAPRGCIKHAPTLRDAGPVLAQLIDNRPDFDPQAWMAQLPPMDLYGALLFQVTGQQLSVPGSARGPCRAPARRAAARGVQAVDYLPSQQKVLASADRWRPYRSLATSYLFSAALEPAEAPPAARYRSAWP